MAERRTLMLTDEQRVELERARDRHRRAHIREKAAALLKIADGMSPHAVAKRGLLKARDPDTVYRWMAHYASEGMEGLMVKPGRGRKPAFSPSVSDE